MHQGGSHHGKHSRASRPHGHLRPRPRQDGALLYPRPRPHDHRPGRGPCRHAPHLHERQSAEPPPGRAGHRPARTLPASIRSSRSPSWWIRSATCARCTSAPWHSVPRRCARSATATPGRSTSRIPKATWWRPISTRPSTCRSRTASRSISTKSDDQILSETEAACRADPGFMPIEQFKQQMAARLSARA